MSSRMKILVFSSLSAISLNILNKLCRAPFLNGFQPLVDL